MKYKEVNYETTVYNIQILETKIDSLCKSRNITLNLIFKKRSFLPILKNTDGTHLNNLPLTRLTNRIMGNVCTVKLQKGEKLLTLKIFGVFGDNN